MKHRNLSPPIHPMCRCQTKRMEDFIEKVKEEGEKSFIVTWRPEDQNWLTEEEMKRQEESMYGQERSYETPQFITDVKTKTLEQSMRGFQKENINDANEDIKEIGQKRMQLFKQIADLHKKESLLVARQRVLELEKCILDETV